MFDLTKPQLDELQRLAKAQQNTYGKGRARVQNKLVELGLAKYKEDGFVCVITEEGHTHLAGVNPPI